MTAPYFFAQGCAPGNQLRIFVAHPGIMRKKLRSYPGFTQENCAF